MVKIGIISFVNYPNRQSRAVMKAVMDYSKGEAKTTYSDVQLISGINCLPDSCYSDFISTKLLYSKDGGVMFYHLIQSFEKGLAVNPVTAHEAATSLAEHFSEHEVLICTHLDREHIHSHLIINSVNFETGKKLHITEQELLQLRQRNDKICMQFNLPVCLAKDKNKSNSMSRSEYHCAAKGESWKFRLLNTIDEAMRIARTKAEFIAKLNSDGYEVRWEEGWKNNT